MILDTSQLTVGTWLQILQIVVILGGGLMVLTTLRSNVRELTTRLIGVEAEMRKLVDVLVTIGRQDERLQAMERRMDLYDHRVNNPRQ